MVLITSIVMKNCRLCHTKPGVHDINDDKRLIKEIYECVKVKVNDKTMGLLPHSVCEECKKTIKSFASYKQEIHQVDQCLRKILKNSKSKDNPEELFNCSECPAEFNNLDVFKKHQGSHSSDFTIKEENEANISCATCKESFKNLEAYGCHQCAIALKNVLGKKEESDDESQRESGDIKDHSFGTDENFDEKGNVENLKNSKNTKFICSLKNCKKVLSSAYSLKNHELKHQGKRLFLCVTCGKSFITKNSLTCHEKIHLEVKGYVCKLCNIGFSVRSNLRQHEKKHHEGVRFYCSQCTKAFSSKCSLERHELIHIGIKNFKCESCPSAFYTRKELLKHERYHQGLRLHKCDECFKTFFERHHLIIHLRSHTGERPYVCKFPNCGKSFTESQKLKRHHNTKHAQT